MIVDLDKLIEATDYLKQFDKTPFYKMEFIKDGQSVSFSLEGAVARTNGDGVYQCGYFGTGL